MTHTPPASLLLTQYRTVKSFDQKCHKIAGKHILYIFDVMRPVGIEATIKMRYCNRSLTHPSNPRLPLHPFYNNLPKTPRRHVTHGGGIDLLFLKWFIWRECWWHCLKIAVASIRNLLYISRLFVCWYSSGVSHYASVCVPHTKQNSVVVNTFTFHTFRVVNAQIVVL